MLRHAFPPSSYEARTKPKQQLNPEPYLIMTYLDMALEAWRDGDSLRSRRRRYKDYTFGRQWGDSVTDTSGRTVNEGDLAASTGFRPHTNNLIRQLVKCVVGNFRNNISDHDPAGRHFKIDNDTARRNALTELDCRMLEEFLISGCAIQRIVTENRPEGCGIWIDNVSPDKFFINHFTDPRGMDIELVGMLHSMSLRELLMRYAASDTDRQAYLTQRYVAYSTADTAGRIGDAVSQSFFNASRGRCRVIELWTLESRSIIKCHDHATGRYFEASGRRRAGLECEAARREKASEPPLGVKPGFTLRWHCRYLAPWGETLREFDSPYAHGQHPFAVKFYPLIDGEVHSLVEDIIDQQRFVNRLITLIDHIMSTSAKGALLVPAESLTPGMTLEDVGRLWAKPNSVIPFRASKGEIHQVTGSGDSAGAYQLLHLQMDLFRQISGVSGAMQGHTATGATSAALYDSQAERSAVAILDLLQSFHAFREARNRKVINMY